MNKILRFVILSCFLVAVFLSPQARTRFRSDNFEKTNAPITGGEALLRTENVRFSKSEKSGTVLTSSKDEPSANSTPAKTKKKAVNPFSLFKTNVPPGVTLSTSPTISFSNSNGFTDNIAQDGEGGSVAISDLDLQTYPINSSGALLTADPLQYHDVTDWTGYPAIITYGDTNPHFGWAIKSIGGSNFSLASLDVLNWGDYGGRALKIEGFDNGTSVGSLVFDGNTNGNYVQLAQTSANSALKLPAAFANVDEVRIYTANNGPDSYISLNNIKVSTAVLSAPTVTTSSATSVKQTTATLGGNVTAQGGSAVSSRGLVWSLTGTPTTGNNVIETGSGTGTFSKSFAGPFPPNTLIHARAYATNTQGTSYGSEVTFTTTALAGTGAVYDFEPASGTYTGFDSPTLTVANTASSSSITVTATTEKVYRSSESGSPTAYFGAEGLYFGLNSTEASFAVVAQNGKTFDLTSFYLTNENNAQTNFVISSAKGSITVTLTGGSPIAANFIDIAGNANAAYFKGITSFTVTPDVPSFMEFDHMVIENIQAAAAAPTVTDAKISISGASGSGGVFKIGDVVTASWNNTSSGDNNSGITAVTVDFSQFGGGSAVAATNSSGTWTATYTIAAGTINGTTNRNVSVTATSSAGSTTTADATNATVDNQAPAKPVILTLAANATTSDNTPTFTGTAEAGSTITAYIDFSSRGTVTADASGNWSFTQPSALSTGSHTIYVTATDAAGNFSVNSVTNNLTITNYPAPVFTSTPVTAATFSVAYSYKATATSGLPLTYSSVTLPAWLSATATAGGNVSTLAGSGTTGLADGTGTAAQFGGPNGLAIDASGNLYVSEALNRIRKVSPVGVVTTLAGSGTTGFADGTGTAAKFSLPRSVAVDAAGNIYVADYSNQRIRKVSSSGVVSTLAGSGTAGFADGTGAAAQFSSPSGVAVDAAGNVYVADTDNNRIRKITPSGVVSTLAGSASSGYADGTGTAAQFLTPMGVAVDASGNVYVTDLNNQRIRKITSAGVVSTLAGSGGFGYADGTGTAAIFSNPSGIAVDASGNVYISEVSNPRIRKITPSGVVSTLAGSGSDGFADGAGTAAQFDYPEGLAVDATGNVYVADHNNQRIRKIAGPGLVLTGTPAASDAGSNPVELKVSDGTSTTNQSFTITVSPPPNTAPELTATGGNTSFTGTAVAIDNALTVSDVDNATLSSATVVVSGNFNSTEDVLGFTNSSSTTYGNIVGSYNTAGGTLTLTSSGATATVAQWQAALRSVTYNNTATTPNTANRVISFTVNDGAVNSNSATKTVTVANTATVTSIVRTGSTPTNTSAVQYTVTFNKSVTGITTSNFSVTTLDVVGASVSSLSGSGTTYTVTVNTGSGSGSLTLNLANASGISPTVSTTLPFAGETYTIDKTAPAITISNLLFSNDNGSSNTDFITNTASQTLTGDLSAALQTGDVVKVSVDNGANYADATVSGTTFTLSGITLTGSNTLKVYVADQLGNQGVVSSQAYVFDTTAPSTSVASLALSADNGASSSDFITNTAAQTISGTLSANLQAGEVVEISVDNGSSYNTATSSVGSNTFSRAGVTLAGSNTIKVRVVDVAGNAGAIYTQAYVIDVTAPAAPVATTPANGALTNNNKPTYSGTGESNATITVYVDGTSIGTTPTDASGNWSYTQVAALAGGSHTFRATATDAAGNVSVNSNTNTFTVDDTAPAAPVLTAPSNNAATNANKPTYSGTAEANSTVTIYVDASSVGTTTANASGIWSYTQAAALSSGSHTVKATATDAAGNTSPFSNTNNFTIDLTAPTIASVSVPANGTYKTNDVLTFTANISEPVNVTGTPRIAITIGSIVQYALFDAAASTSTALKFSYTITSGDNDSNGITIGALSLNSGTINDLAGNSADLTLNSVGSTAGILIDAVAPTITSVSVPANGTYSVGQNLDFTLNYSKSVTVNTGGGTPYITVTLATGAVNAQYVSGSGTSALTYRYTVLSSDKDLDGITLGSTLTLNGGTIKDAAGNNAVTTLNSVGSTAGVLVYGIIPQTITFNSLPAKTYGDADFAPGATSDNADVAVTYTSSNTAVATIVNGNIHIVGAGTTTITASQAADGSHSAATDVQQTLTVNKKAVTITADAKSKTYGDADPALTYQVTSGALVGTDTFTGSLTRDAGENKGAYAIKQGTLALSSNYALTYAGANLAINAKAVTVTADAKSKVYGQADPALTYQITSGSLVTGDGFTGSLTRDAGETAGTYAIKQGSLTAGNNYTLTYASANLTIAPAAIIVTADAKNKVYGQADPALTYQVTSGALVTGDSFTGSLTRDAGENAGTYAIKQGTLSAGSNYTLTYSSANLTIAPAAVTVTADSKSKTYGQADPALTYQITSGTLVTGDSFNGSLTRDAGENVGIYAIKKGTLALSNNYALTYAGANLSITKAALTVTANNQTKTYGQANPALTVSYSGFINGEDKSNLTTQPTLNTTAVTSSPAGTYLIKASGAASNNYAITYVDGTLTITAAQPAITFAALPVKVYGDADFAPGATSSNTATPVTYASSNTAVATIVSGKIHIVGAGTTNITASQAADANNYAAADVTKVLTVSPKPITVTADAKTKVYGQSDPALTYQITSGSLVTGDSFSGSLTRDAGENVGTYAIKQGTLTAGNNYTLSYTGASLSVTPAALTITADNKTKVYGAANPALTASYAGFVSGDNAASLAAQPTLTTTATTASPVGTYAITVSGAVSPNYTISYAAGSLTVTRAPLTITADNKAKVYGAANPALTASYAGFVSGDNAQSLTTQPVLSTTATAVSPAGTYDITVSGAASPNYTITFNKGTLTVNKATLTVTADNQTKIYGQANPALTVSYAGFVNGDNASRLTTQPVATTTATTASGVGTYAIVPAGGVSASYGFNYISGTLTVTPAVRTLDFTALHYKAYGDADFDAGATASTGEAIIYTSSNPGVATIVNGKVHITGAGMTNITATVAANPNYTSAPAITQMLVVNKGQQSITFAAIPNQIKGAKYTLPAVTASSGLPVTLTSSDAVIASLSGQTLTANRLGRVSVIATQPGNDNYLPAAVVIQGFDVLDAAGEEVLIRRAVSPNGDGINDFLYIEGVNQHLNNTVTVINRNGAKVFEVKNYDNSSRAFDGHSNITGAMQQAGTYFYLLEYTVDGVGRRKTGWFILKY